MKIILILVHLILIMVSTATAHAMTDSPVEVIAIRETGISEADESKSVIEVRWKLNPAMTAPAGIFRLQLSVTYADGTTLLLTQDADGESMYAQFEVPSAKLSKRQPPALIRKINAVVIAVLPKQPIQTKKEPR